MTAFQKVIKYFGIWLAIFICLSLLVGLISVVKNIFENFDILKEEDSNYNEVIDYDTEFKYLDINLNSSNLIIESGDKFKINTSDENIKIYTDNNKLKIVDKNKKYINRKVKDFIITIPKDYSFESVKINTGAGKLNINSTNTYLLEMNIGACEAILNNINSKKSLIEVGTGSVKISESNLNDLSLELGVGKISINGKITGYSSIENGVGELDLFLDLPLHNYTFNLEKGIGEIKLNNELITNNKVIGEGENVIKVEGGIGSINIKTLEN